MNLLMISNANYYYHRSLFLLVLMSVFMLQGRGQPLYAGDVQALRMVRRSLRDLPGSSFFASSWGESADPCSYSGVVCSLVSQQRRVVILDLGFSSSNSAGLAGRLDPAVGQLTALRQLTLAPGKVSGRVPDSLANLALLQYLALSRNYFTGVIPPSLAALSNLHTLDLCYNRLQGSLPTGLGNLPHLTALVLGHNLLSGNLPVFTSPLTHLDLKSNDLEGGLISFPTTLNYLNLARNRLSGSLNAVANLERLLYLDLSFNRLTGSIPSSIFSFKLNSLYLQRNQLSGSLSPSNLVYMGTVDLSFNEVTGSIPPFLAFVQNLYLNNNHMTGVVPQEFVDRIMASSLQTLYLQHNYLTGFGIDPSSPLPLSCALCIQYNCMMPPVKSPCPASAGREPSRPAQQCVTSYHR